jgi:Holliday junction resolvase-like predicted endonuclease
VESISKKQQQRIIRGTLYLKSQQPQLPEACRFDVAIVTPEKIWHVENAWSCDGGY